jgi:hypothetical protein
MLRISRKGTQGDSLLGSPPMQPFPTQSLKLSARTGSAASLVEANLRSKIPRFSNSNR